jgi:hypothetical protein
MKRRHFVLLASAGVAAVSIPVVNYFFYEIPDYDKKLSIPQLLSLIWDEENIMATGAKYGEKFPEESNERALARALFANSTNRSYDKLEEMTQTDFSEGRLVIIDGWVLSKTEARQCALHYLLNQKKA